MAFVHEQEKIVREIVEQGGRRFSHRAAGDGRGIILNAGAVPHFLEHLEIVFGTGLEAFRLEHLALDAEAFKLLVELLPDCAYRAGHCVFRHHEVLGRVDGKFVHLQDRLPGYRMEFSDSGNFFPVKLDPIRFLEVRGENLEHIAPRAEPSPLENGVVPFVLQGHQFPLELVRVDYRSLLDMYPQVAVGLGQTETVDAGNGGHDDYVVPLHEAEGRREAEPVDFLIDGCVFFNIQVPRRNIGFRLVVVVVRYKVFNGVVREESLELTVELGGECLVMTDDEGGPLYLFDDLGHGKGLSGTGNPAERLEPVPGENPRGKRIYGLPLVAGRFIFRDNFERPHYFRSTSCSVRSS